MAETIKSIDDQIAALEKLRGVLPEAQFAAMLADLQARRARLVAEGSLPSNNVLEARDITAENVVVGTQIINNFGKGSDDATPLSPKAQALYPLLNQYFSLTDLEDLSFQLGIDWDDLRGDTKGGKARALLLHCDRHDLLPNLVGRMRAARPNLKNQLSALG